MRIVFAGVFALSLAACSDQPYDAEADATEAEPLASDVQLRPGLYRMQISIDGGQSGAASQFADDNTCLTQEDVAGGYREMLLDMQGRDTCRFDSYDLEDGQLNAVMNCKGDDFQPETEARISGTLTPQSTDLKMTVAGFEDGTSGIEMRVASERIGDCEADKSKS